MMMMMEMMFGLSGTIVRQHISGHKSLYKSSGCQVEQRQIKMLFRKIRRILMFLTQSATQINCCLFLSGLYFIWQVYSASPIFGVEFETEEKVKTINYLVCNKILVAF